MNNEFDIAIVGMAGRFPGARNLEEFWRNLAEGIESMARLSDQEILESGVPASHLNNPSYVKAAPILEEPGGFDAEFFGFSPMEARTMDPQHRLLLELAYEALESAGCDPERYPGRIGVFAGSALNTYFTNVGLNRRLAEDYIPTLIGNDKDFLSTRISYKLNLKGPSITVQTACSTSMVAVHLARQSLLSGESDMALAGAVSVRVPHRAGYFCDGGGVVSPDGHVRAFDAKANGTVFGSGGGILVLKRLADALADGNTIRAVIKGSAVNNDGSEKAGYTAPSVNSQADAVVEALANAGIEADRISYVETHGSGTPVGDPMEVSALTKAFRVFTQRSGYCAIGSVKTNVGHLDAAAGVAGIIKTVLALEQRQLPPSLHFTKPNPEIDFPSTPFYVNTQLREWTGDSPRRAGVMSTGMGGTNAHLVLEEAPEASASTPANPPHLLILSAKTETALDQATHRLRDFLKCNESANMSDVAYTLQIGRKAFLQRRCLVCADREDAIAVLGEENSKRIHSQRADDSRRPIIFLLPGIGDHYVGMAHDLYERWAVFKQEVDQCSQILEGPLGVDIRKIIYPDSRNWNQQDKPQGIDLKQMLGRKPDAPVDQDSRKLNQTLFAQPVLFTIEYAMARLWQSLGIVPDAVAGHSMGEFVAACLAGVLSLEDGLRLIATRAKLVSELPQGAMLAVTLPENELLPLLPEDLSISLINGPRLCVVAGPVAAVAEFEKMLNERSVICRHVQNAHAFHSRMLDPIVKTFETEVGQVQLNEPAIPFISNVSGTWITGREATDPAYWAKHVNHTARFSDALNEVWKFKNPILLEVGPGRTLGVLAMQHPGRPSLRSYGLAGRESGGEPSAVASIRPHYENRSDVEFLWHAIGTLWVSGAEINWDGIYRSERLSEKPVLGSTGYQPVPSGNLPDGTSAASMNNSGAGFGATPAAIPVGRLPTGAGRLPAPPIFQTGSERRRRVQLPTYPFERQQHWLEPVRVPDAVSQTQVSVQKNPDTSQWLYVPSWKRLLPRVVGLHEAALPSEKARTWLVFADDCGFALRLVTKLKSAGLDVTVVRAAGHFQQVDSRTFTIEPADPQQYDLLIQSLEATQSLPDRIVHAWNVTGIPTDRPEGERFIRAQALGFYSLLFLDRALAVRNVGHEIQLFVLSNNVQEVHGTETLCPEKSTLLGPCMVIRQEYPNIRVKSIDLDVSENIRADESTSNLVLGECLNSDSNVFVAYRNAHRWVQTYEPVVPGSANSNCPTFREGGVYLITGGLGKIGIAISEYLAKTYHVKLVLVGRSNLPARESWSAWIDSHPEDDASSARIRAIEKIENLGGKVLCLAASVGDLNAMRRVVEQADQTFGALHGVIHGAGIVGDDAYCEIKDCDHTKCDGHFQAKAHGLLVLEEVLASQALDFCLLLSSLASVLGGIGQAAYASANIYMDSFARRHNRKSPVGGAEASPPYAADSTAARPRSGPWLSVNWDVWRLQDDPAIGAGLGTTLKELGLGAAEAMRMMETTLAMRTAGQLVVSTGDLGARINQWIQLESLHPTGPPAVSSPSRRPSQRPSLRTNYEAPRDETEQQIARIWQDALGIDDIGIHDHFAQLGGHSLMAIRIVTELRKEFQMDLPVRALFDAPTMADLSSYIQERLAAEIDGLTDDEARELISNT